MIQLRGITWGHVRGIAPLKAATEEYKNFYPDVSIVWDVRSLKDFEDYPLQKLTANYDLILMDHPFIGEGAEKELILPLDEWIDSEFLLDQKKNTVGKSYTSYSWLGHQWALAVDAAAQVAAYRKDLLESSGLPTPSSWAQVFELISELPDGLKVGIPLNPTHAYCSFLALCANVGGNDFFDEDRGIEVETGIRSLEFLKKLVPLVHHCSLEMNPIGMSDLMSNSNEIAYVPLMFGYSNYARHGFAPHLIDFIDIPSTTTDPLGAVLGGVGIAVSATSNQRKAATQFACYVASKSFQSGGYFTSGGQPGHRMAWMDESVNLNSNSFFKNTLRTLDHAFLRPRKQGYAQFQEKAGELIHPYLKHGDNAGEIVEQLNKMYYKTVIEKSI